MKGRPPAQPGLGGFDIGPIELHDIGGIGAAPFAFAYAASVFIYISIALNLAYAASVFVNIPVAFDLPHTAAV